MQTFTGLEYLKIDIASNFGLDKENWDVRLAWTDQHEDELEQLLPAAEEPALYHAAVQAYRKAQKGQPSGYPISLDACASGLQILSVLWGCRESAKLCGVVPTGKREDAYTTLYQHMCDQIGENAKIARADTKKAIMTALYSSQRIPREVFGSGNLLKIFYETMETRVPGAWELNKILQGLWQPYATHHSWIMPDNFHAHVPVEDAIGITVNFLNAPVTVPLTVNRGTKEGRSIGPNIVHSIDGLVVREIHRRCTFDPARLEKVYRIIEAGSSGLRERTEDDHIVKRLWALYESSGFLSARILDHLRASNAGWVDLRRIKQLLLSMPEKPFEVLSVHDCFRVLPNYGNDLRRQYNRLLAEIADSQMLAFIASQVTGMVATHIKPTSLAAEILETDYALS